MGYDVAVTLTRERVPERRLLGLIAGEIASVSPNSETYILLTDRGKPQGFSIWSSDPWSEPGGFDLFDMCGRLCNQIGPLCTAWKSDHGGCAGWVIHRPGLPVECDDTSKGDYDLWLPPAVEKAFSICLHVPEEDIDIFPELFFAQERGYRVEAGKANRLSRKGARRVWDRQTSAEPTFPV